VGCSDGKELQQFRGSKTLSWSSFFPGREFVLLPEVERGFLVQVGSGKRLRTWPYAARRVWFLRRRPNAGLAGEDGKIRFWDVAQELSAFSLQVPSAARTS